MGETTGIEWAGSTFTPIRARNKATQKVGWHCTHVSEACRFCYAETLNMRLGTGLPFKPGHEKDIDIFLDEKMLMAPLKWKTPRRIFICSMTDLFGEFVKDEWIDKILAVAALCPQHTFMVLTKRSGRMRGYMTDPNTPFRVTQQIDKINVGEFDRTKERVVPIEGFPGYFVSDAGRVLTETGSARCVHCGADVNGETAAARYCSKQCRFNAQYRMRMGKPMRFEPEAAEMSPDVGEDGHNRVMLYRDRSPVRELIHRLVLSAFDRPPVGDEQGRHADRDPRNNTLANLSWGDQSANWDDSKRHGTHQRATKLTRNHVDAIRSRYDAGESGEALAKEYDVSSTQIRNIACGRQWNIKPAIAWPLPRVWLGVSAEDQSMWDQRVDDLVATPAAVRFVSYEPALGPIRMSHRWKVDLVIAGGESGSDPRPVNLEWFKSLIRQCKECGTMCFIKQLGPKPIGLNRLKDKKGGTMEEWPEDLRVREMP